MNDPTGQDSSLTVVVTLVVLFGIGVAALKWRSQGEDAPWRALTSGMSSPEARPLPLPMPNVIRGK